MKDAKHRREHRRWWLAKIRHRWFIWINFKPHWWQRRRR